MLKPNTTGEYRLVRLYKDNKYKIHYIHRLVAEAFILNNNNYSCVNHKDENKHNNYVENLEWCSKKYNCNYGTRNEKMSKSKCKYKIIQKNKVGDILKIWNNAVELKQNTKFDIKNIRRCCQNKGKYAYGFMWEYETIKP